MTTTDQPTDSLLGALSKARVPADNHDFVRRITAGVDIGTYRAVAVDSSKPYVIATRRDGLPDLHIYHGYTTGFATEDEIVRSVGNAALRERTPRKDAWYVAHPVNKVRPGGGQRSRNVPREAGFCSCGMQLPLTGQCGYCG